MGVQAEGSDYMVQAWKNDEDVMTKPPIEANTVADSISAGLPRDRIKAMAAVKETDGAYLSVSDDEILRAIPDMARGIGVFGEPAGAAAYAGLKKSMELDLVSRDEVVVVLNTGNGLKDIAGAMKSIEMTGPRAHRVEPDLKELKRIVQKIM